ncbi:uncharacterized protein [Montipora foliosa]|uniref:uncharacterized protein isoform X1 n=1 Tax=Montipora foliosa TaxID=591990 RepID=UPI0035F145ED
MASLSVIRWLLCSTLLFSFLEFEPANGNHTTDQPFPFSNMSEVSLCACLDSQHRIYNLASLAKSGGSPRFTVKAKDAYWYSYNPCLSFALGTFGDCFGGDVAICRWTNDTSYTDIGSQKSVRCGHTSQGTMKLVYTKGSQWHSEVHLKCDPERKGIQDAEFTVITDVKAGAMKFCLKHNCACPDGCPEDPTKRSSVTTPSDAPSWKKTVISVVIAAGGILFVFIAIIAIVRLVRRRNIQAEQRPLINGGDNQGHEQINVPPAAASGQADESSDHEEYFTPPVSMTSISEHDSSGSKDTNKQGPRRVRGGASPAKLNVLV